MKRTLSGICCLLFIAALGSDRTHAQTQPTKADQEMDTLREGIPSERDDPIVDRWIAEKLTDLRRDIDNPILREDAIKRFEDTVKAQYNHSGNSAKFKEKVAERLSVTFTTEFAKGQDLEVAVGRATARVLLQLENGTTKPAMLAGLKHPDSAVRYMCAKSLNEVQNAIVADAQQVADAVADAGAIEGNGVVVAQMYGAVAFEDRKVEGVGAVLKILEGRLKSLDAPGRELDRGELPAIEYLDQADSGGGLADPVRRQIVLFVGKLLRIHTERFAAATVSEFERAGITAMVERSEALLNRIVKPASAPDVTSAILKNDAINAQIELLRWIGSADTPGALNGAPWTVPVGA